MMPAGRPTKYCPEIVQAALDYLNGGYKDYEDEYEKEVIPSVSGLAVRLGLARSTVNEWGTDESKPEFSDIYQSILAKQENILINRGLEGAFNSAIAKLALGKHGYSDKTENAHMGADNGPIQVESIERIIVKA